MLKYEQITFSQGFDVSSFMSLAEVQQTLNLEPSRYVTFQTGSTSFETRRSNAEKNFHIEHSAFIYQDRRPLYTLEARGVNMFFREFSVDVITSKYVETAQFIFL